MLLAFANLRGAKESGLLFAIPTYSFIAVIVTLVIVGIVLVSVMPMALGWLRARFAGRA